ncbi:hypothetical protein Tco_0853244 [Tanacetum coccineum]
MEKGFLNGRGVKEEENNANTGSFTASGTKVTVAPTYSPDVPSNIIDIPNIGLETTAGIYSTCQDTSSPSVVQTGDELVSNGGSSKESLNVAHDSSSNTPIIEKIDKLERQILDEKLMFVDDDGKPLHKVASTVNVESDREVLLEQWRETKRDDDYDLYDDDLYKSHDMSGYL